MLARIKNKPSYILITGLKKGANIIARNNNFNESIKDNAGRKLVVSFKESNIECLLRLENELIVS